MTEALLAGLLIGLAGTGHCLVMCGPLAASLSLNFSPDRLRGAPHVRTLMWVGLGKVTVYAGLGALAGLVGQQVSITLGLGPVLIGSGFMLLVMGLYGLGLSPPTHWFAPLLRPLRSPLSAITRRVTPINTHFRSFVWGGAWGLLPCGLVYAALGWSLTQPTPIAGAMGMLGFGLGTLPAALGSGYLGARLGWAIKSGRAARASGIALLLLGTLSIASGFAQG